jgi:hypothetical protein
MRLISTDPKMVFRDRVRRQYRKLKSLLSRLERLSQTALRQQVKRAQSAHRG